MIKAIKTFFTYITGILTGVGFGALGIAIFAVLMQESDKRLSRKPSYPSYRPYTYTPPKYSYSEVESDIEELMYLLKCMNVFNSLTYAEDVVKDIKNYIEEYSFITFADLVMIMDVQLNKKSVKANINDYGWEAEDAEELKVIFENEAYKITFPKIKRV